MYKAFQYRLYPTHAQARSFESVLEICRQWYNTCLAEGQQAWAERGETLHRYAQYQRVTELKHSDPRVARIHTNMLRVVVDDLDLAFKAFFRRVKAGQNPGYPRFKGLSRFHSFGLKEYREGYKLDGRRLRLWGIGRVRVRWHRPLEGTPKSLRITRKAGLWYASFNCEVPAKPLEPTGREVGVDVGINHLITTSDGEAVDNPRWYRHSQSKLRILQRRVSRRTIGGSNWGKALRAVQRHHAHIANQRKDYLCKLAHHLITSYDRIALEDLQVANLVQNSHISKSITDAGWSFLKTHLVHKAEEAGLEVVLVDPAQTSRLCSQCGRVFENLTLSDRWVQCECGLSMDRDRNAALNVLKRAGHAQWGITWADGPSVPQEATRQLPLWTVTSRDLSSQSGTSGPEYRL